jgi:DNA-binding NarL/FixJ family response regulator
MSEERESASIEIGLVAAEPIRMEGLLCVFELPSNAGTPRLHPIPGVLHELLARPSLRYLVLDLNSLSGYTETLEVIRCERPDVRLIVIGPANDDQMVISSIIAGARAHLDVNASPENVRQAIDVVVSGSIWAPRRLLSRLIDRLLTSHDTSLTSGVPQLTERERQVLELILLARSNREIASQLGIEERTVKAYVGRLMRKAGADNRVKLSMSALGLSIKHRPDEIGKEPDNAPYYHGN